MTRHYWTLGAILVAAGCGVSNGDGLEGERIELAASAATFGVNPSGSSAVFFVDNASWADIHYRVDGGQQLNVRMAISGTHNEFVVGNLTSGRRIDYNFTLFDLGCSCAHDSPAAVYVHGNTVPPVDAGTPPVDSGVPSNETAPYPRPNIPAGPTTGGSDRSTSVVALHSADTAREPSTIVDTGSALVTRVGDRVRDRHAREAQFHIYEHFLPLYFKDRTHWIEIVDTVAKGGSQITINLNTIFPQDKPNVRAFFRGITTVAEYWYNADFAQVNDRLYTSTLNYNAKEGRAIRVGDRMEIEVGIFLRPPFEGRFNYYSTTFLYVVGSGGIKPFYGAGSTLDSFALPANALLGGATTLNYPYSNEPDKSFMQMALDMAPVSAQPWVEGRRLHHTDFTSGAHSEDGNPVFQEQANKIGPNFVARSCVSCHVRNGRGLPPAVRTSLTNFGVKVGELSGSAIVAHSRLGTTLQPNRTSGSPEGSAQISGYTTQTGRFADGASYELRRANYAGTGPIPTHYSVRATPQLIGVGLLEAVPESAIAALVDVNDRDGDGVSGRMQVVNDRTTGQVRMGRFGWKAGQPRVIEQIASALNREMGVKTSFLPTLDCGSSQTGCTSNAAALSDADLAKMARYTALLGVPARRDLSNAAALAGESLFTSAGCATCHRASLTTSAFHPNAELRNQTIRAFTDLLLHDMGPGLADNLPEGEASGAEWRTPPLWGIGLTAAVSGGEAYLHDGRARNLSEAILWHDGEGLRAKNAFVNMSASQRASLLTFLGTL